MRGPLGEQRSGTRARGTLRAFELAAALLGACVLLGTGLPASADVGGTLAAGRSGDFRIHLLAYPLPLAEGASDWSVLVRDATTGRIVEDARVEIRMNPAPPSPGTAHEADRALALPGKHPGFYSARLHLEGAADWQGNVMVHGGEGDHGSLAFAFPLRPARSPWQEHWGALVFPFVLLGGFAWHQQRSLAMR